MDIGGTLFGFLYQIGDAAAFLVLASAGLAVVFGMMGVINMAHGEFIMFGAYGTAMAVRAADHALCQFLPGPRLGIRSLL